MSWIKPLSQVSKRVGKLGWGQSRSRREGIAQQLAVQEHAVQAMVVHLTRKFVAALAGEADADGDHAQIGERTIIETAALT